MTRHTVATPEAVSAYAHRATQRRTAGAALVAGPATFLLFEFIAAAAWTDHPYS